jgi:ABC-type hemin transport system ATPase subunit
VSRTQTLAATGVAVAGTHGGLLPATSIAVSRGELRAAVGDPGHGHTALALALAGRLRLDAGTVELTGRNGAAALQAAVALVDVPGVSEPDAALPLATSVAEGLAIAGRRAGRTAVRHWLAARDLAHLARRRMEDVPVPDRTRVLADLAAERPRVNFLVLTLPERHGGAPGGWLPHLRALADREYGVLVTVSPTTAPLLDLPTTVIGPEEDA